MPAVITRLPINELLLLGQTLWQRPRLFHTAALSSFMHLSRLVDAGTAHTCLPSNRELHNPTVVCSACTVTYNRYARSERWLSNQTDTHIGCFLAGLLFIRLGTLWRQNMCDSIRTTHSLTIRTCITDCTCVLQAMACEHGLHAHWDFTNVNSPHKYFRHVGWTENVAEATYWVMLVDIHWWPVHALLTRYELDCEADLQPIAWLVFTNVHTRCCCAE